MQVWRAAIQALLLLGVLSVCMAATLPELEKLRQAAAQGDPWAQLNLGAAYDHGMAGATVDPNKAVAWYRRAAEQGLAKAQFSLAHCLATGHGVAQDYVQARFWMHKAAAQNMVDAQFLLGVMWAEGLGGKTNLIRSRKWLEQAASSGQQDAQGYLNSLVVDK